MKALSHIRYFSYLAWNWNISIAWKIIKEEIKGENKYGIDTTGADELKSLEDRGIDISHATIYMPVSYSLLEDIFAHLETQAGALKYTHFLDIGCGKGRALCVAAHHRFTKLTGLDFSRELCEAAKKNLAITRQAFPELQYNIINNDAFYYDIPEDADCIFLFNPFDEVIMSGVLNRLFSSLHTHPRELDLIYVNPVHKQLFINAGFKETWYCKKMQYLEASVLSIRHHVSIFRLQ